MTVPVDWTSIEEALYNWATTKTDWATIWQDQNVPQPEYPYLSLKRLSSVKEGGKAEVRYDTDLTRPTGQENEFTATYPLVFTLNIQGHIDEDSGANDPNNNAVSKLELLKSTLGLPSVQSTLYEADLAVVEELDVLDNSLVINGQFINRASLDVRFRTVSVITERTGYIDKVEISSPELGIDPVVIDAS